MKRAFTLIELVVYMAIMGFIIVVAGRVFSDSSSMRVRTQNMVKATEELNKVVAIIKEDMSQMGAKTYKKPRSATSDSVIIKGVNVDATDEFLLNENVYVSKANKDFSSFDLLHRDFGNGKNNDSIAFKKIILDKDGKNMGVRLISWALRADKILYRRCATINKTNYVAADDEEASICAQDDLAKAQAVAIANDIQAFRLLPSLPGNPPVTDENTKHYLQKFPSSSSGNLAFKLINKGTNTGTNTPSCTVDSITYKGINMVTLRNFARNDETSTTATNHNELYVADANNSNVNDGSTYTACEKFNFKIGETYSIKFKTPPIDNKIDTLMTLFQPGKDHISIGFRRADNGERYTNVEGLKTDFMFYVPQTKDYDVNSVNHYFEFSVKEEVLGACAVFTFAFYGPKANIGKLAIKDFEIWQKQKAYHFPHDGDPDYAPLYATVADPDTKKLERKKSVKAFELYLEINKGKTIEGITTFSTIPTPNNGIESEEVL